MTRHERIIQAKQLNLIFELANLKNTETAVNGNIKELVFDKNNEVILIPENSEVKAIEKKLIKSKLTYFKNNDMSTNYKTIFIVRKEVM